MRHLIAAGLAVALAGRETTALWRLTGQLSADVALSLLDLSIVRARKLFGGSRFGGRRKTWEVHAVASVDTASGGR